MPRTHPAYPQELRQRLVELVHAGRTPEELAQEYEPSAGSIRNWVAQGEHDTGQRSDGLNSEERQELRRLRRENKQLRIERDILKKSSGLVRSGERLDPGAGFEFVKANQAVWPVRTVCRVLGLSPSGYYAWVGRAPSARARRDQQLQEQIKELWDANRQGYGRPRIHAEPATTHRAVPSAICAPPTSADLTVPMDLDQGSPPHLPVLANPCPLVSSSQTLRHWFFSS